MNTGRRWQAALSLGMAIATTGCGEPAQPPDSAIPEVPFDSLFVLQDSVRLQDAADDPVAEAEALVRWNGALALVDGTQANVKVFSDSGVLLMTLGRAGNGPGEFRNPSEAAALPGGQLAVLDQHPGRLSLFDRSGEWIGGWVPQQLTYKYGALLLASDSTILIGAQVADGPAPAEGRPPMTRGLHEFTFDGRLKRSFPYDRPAQHPHESSIDFVYGARVGPTAVATIYPSGDILNVDLRTGERSWSSLPSTLWKPFEWLDAEGVTMPEELHRWIRTQTGISGPVGIDSVRYLLPLKDSLFTYVVVDRRTGPVIVTDPSPTYIYLIEGRSAYGVDIDDRGESWLLRYSFMLDGELPE